MAAHHRRVIGVSQVLHTRHYDLPEFDQHSAPVLSAPYQARTRCASASGERLRSGETRLTTMRTNVP